MFITLVPTRALPNGRPLRLSVDYDRLAINGEWADFSPLPEGAKLPHAAIGSDVIVGDVTREGGDIHLSVAFPVSRDVLAEMPVTRIGPLDNGRVKLPVTGLEQ